MVYNGPLQVMKEATHFAYGNYFFSYGVQFVGLAFRLKIAYGVSPSEGIYGYLPEKRWDFYSENKPIYESDIEADLKRPLKDRIIFTRTTIRHFDYYMEKYYFVSNAYQRLKQEFGIQ